MEKYLKFLVCHVDWDYFCKEIVWFPYNFLCRFGPILDFIKRNNSKRFFKDDKKVIKYQWLGTNKNIQMYKGCWDLFCKNVWFFLNKIVCIFGPKIDFLKGIEGFDLFRFWNIIIDSFYNMLQNLNFVIDGFNLRINGVFTAFAISRVLYGARYGVFTGADERLLSD